MFLFGNLEIDASDGEVWPQWCVRMLNRRLAELPDVKEPWLEQVRAAITQVRDVYANGMPSARAAASANEQKNQQ